MYIYIYNLRFKLKYTNYFLISTLQQEASLSSSSLNNEMNTCSNEGQTNCKVSRSMKILMIISTACVVLASIIIPLAIIHEKEGIQLSIPLVNLKMVKSR